MPRDFSPQNRDDLDRILPDAEVRETERERQETHLSQETLTSRPPERPQEHARQEPERRLHFADGRIVLYDRDRGYRLNESQIHTVVELGKFRVVAAEDLAAYAYGGDREEAGHDIENLVRQGLA